jgi:uncharacterized protein involved in exopolysaccharide biosynthesis
MTAAEEISPLEALNRLLSRWQQILLWAALGALGGLAFSLLVPPRYEAIAAFAVSIDYGRTEPLELVVEDRVLDRVWQLVHAPDILEATAERLRDEHGPDEAWASVESLREHIRLDARLSRWELIGIHRDPRKAAAIANAWYETVLNALQEAWDHAWRAASLQGEAFQVECVAGLQGLDDQALWQCFAGGPSVEPERLEALKAEVRASRGILPVIQFEGLGGAQVPRRPAACARGLLVLAGGLLGLGLACGWALRGPVTPGKRRAESDR